MFILGQHEDALVVFFKCLVLEGTASKLLKNKIYTVLENIIAAFYEFTRSIQRTPLTRLKRRNDLRESLQLMEVSKWNYINICLSY